MGHAETHSKTRGKGHTEAQRHGGRATAGREGARGDAETRRKTEEERGMVFGWGGFFASSRLRVRSRLWASGRS
jgi:hypothetical protein